MTTIDSFNPASATPRTLVGRLASGAIAAVMAVLRLIVDEVVYMVREDGYHGRIRRGEDE